MTKPAEEVKEKRGARGRVGKVATNESAPAVRHARVVGKAFAAETTKAVFGGEGAVFGAESLFPTAGATVVGSLESLEAAAVPAGLLSYGDNPTAKFERLRAVMTDLPTKIARGPIAASIESVFGVDTRVRVDPAFYPHSALCFLLIQFPLNTTALGTGWIIGRRTIITAGHCVYVHGEQYGSKGGAFANRIVVFPQRNNTSKPHQFEATTQNLQTTQGWIDAANPAVDYAAIILDTDLPENLGAFGFGSDLDPSVRDGAFHVVGYPGEFQQNPQLAATLWEDTGTVTVKGAQLAYRIDTSPGQSGGPVYYINKSDNPKDQYAVAVGIHNYGIHDPNDPKRFEFPESQPGTNTATYITGDVLTNLLAWQSAGGG